MQNLTLSQTYLFAEAGELGAKAFGPGTNVALTDNAYNAIFPKEMTFRAQQAAAATLAAQQQTDIANDMAAKAAKVAHQAHLDTL